MNFDFKNAFDGRRLTNMTRASVQANGRLNFPPDATRQMDLSLEKALLICPMGEKDLAVTVVDKSDERGFGIHKTGPYYYVPFRSLLNECGIDCTKQHVVYDIIELNEKYEGHSVFKFNRRIVGEHEKAEIDGEVETVEPQQEPVAAPSVAEASAPTPTPAPTLATEGEVAP